MKDFAKSIRTNNSSVCNKAIVLKDGNVWVVLYANETKSQEFETEEEAREFAKKVGNSNVEITIIAPNGEKVKAIDYDQWHYKCVDTGELVEKRLSKVVGNRKVGNSNYADDAYSLADDFRDATKKDGGEDKAFITRSIQKARERVQTLESKKREYLESLKDIEEAIKVYKTIV